MKNQALNLRARGLAWLEHPTDKLAILASMEVGVKSYALLV